MEKFGEQKKEFKVRARVAETSLIPINIHDYEDIFSDFDPRSYVQKALSADFLAEIKRASKDKPSGEIELRFLVADKHRSKNDEVLIKKRLEEHFRKHHLEKHGELRKIKIGGIIWISAGILAVTVAIIIKALKESAIVNSVVEPLLVIPGWFGLWEGLGKIFIIAKDREEDYIFYEKMSKCRITFQSYN